MSYPMTIHPMTIHRIRSKVLASKGERYESADRKRAETRLKEVRKVDPDARLLSIPVQR